jgi:hypothetical protein
VFSDLGEVERENEAEKLGAVVFDIRENGLQMV